MFEGIPLLAQLFFIFYALPLIVPRLNLSTYATAITVLTLNAIAHIASLGNAHADIFKKPIDYPNKLKVLVLVVILEFGRLIKYSTLLSVIAFADLLRSAVVLMNSASDILAVVIAIIIYSILNILIKSTYALLKKAFFKNDIAEGTRC
jgi:polar amino acid transport system permease protein